MLFLKHSPVPAISEFVEYLWLVSDAPSHSHERILPTGTLELVVNLCEDQVRIYDDAGACRRFSGAVMSGAYSRPFTIDTAEHALAMGVHFRPGGAAPFMRCPPGKLADLHVDVEALWGAAARELRDRLCAARSHRARFDILESVLVARAAEGGSSRSSVQLALRRFGQPRAKVSEIVASAGVSHRHFVSLFRDEVGMAPKLFMRVQRFQRTLALAERYPEADWAHLALECGYGDQSHLIHDFSAFAGCTPGKYRRRRGDPVKDHHVALE